MKPCRSLLPTLAVCLLRSARSRAGWGQAIGCPGRGSLICSSRSRSAGATRMPSGVT